jgi:hypothetical protein
VAATKRINEPNLPAPAVKLEIYPESEEEVFAVACGACGMGF